MSYQDTALRMLSEHGESLILTKHTGASVDPVTGDRTAGTTITAYPYGVPITDKKTVGKYFGSADSVEKVYIIDAAVVIEPGLQIECSEGVFRVSEVKAQKYQGADIYYIASLVK